MKIKIQTVTKKQLIDTQTPVSIYLKVRDMYPESALLESSDFHSMDNSFSFIGIEPLARFSVKQNRVTQQLPDGNIEVYDVDHQRRPEDMLNDFVHRFEVNGQKSKLNGFFGYTAYDAVRYFEDIPVKYDENDETGNLPEMTYILYRFVIAINHLRNEMTLTENLCNNRAGGMQELLSILESRNFPSYHFSVQGTATSPVTDEQYREFVRRGIHHCLRGDVFQIVLSRRFEQDFKGDDFKVYRALRSINPSPYLFYFDFGSYRIFGSSPETHVKVEGDRATIDPIAGTFHRTGDDAKDEELARQLLADPKENAEHVMLVDLARNDLSRNATDVKVASFKEVQFYSHVIHLLSRVTGTVAPEVNRIRLFADTIPAGTLSGAPKVRAMQLINEIEQQPRGIYGGCIGYIGLDGDINHAITIRSFLSRNNKLYFQAGAGIIAKSNPEKELQEVNNKLEALHKAIELAVENWQ
ncbi:MAG: anthranilate synthase component I family protein [Bacteroidales bacterium]|jgi:anthranilate synthase component 1|nr:anthranilate synthase component I family protein [Bacteroidales bacterium]